MWKVKKNTETTHSLIQYCHQAVEGERTISRERRNQQRQQGRMYYCKQTRLTSLLEDQKGRGRSLMWLIQQDCCSTPFFVLLGPCYVASYLLFIRSRMRRRRVRAPHVGFSAHHLCGLMSRNMPKCRFSQARRCTLRRTKAFTFLDSRHGLGRRKKTRGRSDQIITAKFKMHLTFSIKPACRIRSLRESAGLF